MNECFVFVGRELTSSSLTPSIFSASWSHCVARFRVRIIACIQGLAAEISSEKCFTDEEMSLTGGGQAVDLIQEGRPEQSASRELKNSTDARDSFIQTPTPQHDPQRELLELTAQPLSAEALEDAYRAHINASLLKMHKLSASAQIEKRGAGFFVEDRQGNLHLDCIAGFGVFSFGHAHPEIIADVRRQLETLPLSSKFMLNEPYARLAKALSLLTPKRLTHSFLCNSGTEAVEGALKLARVTSGRSQIIAMEGAFHGKTLGALSVSGRACYRDGCGALLPECDLVAFGDAQALLEKVSERTAAVIVEPIQGEGGVRVPPPGWLREVRTICDFYGALLIVDEVQTGLGRTGRIFACEWERVEPDLLCLGKALGGGVIPAAAVVGSERAFRPLLNDPMFHTSTFGGNPLACVAALAAIRILVRDELADNAQRQGQALMANLRDLAERFPDLIEAVRGRGLLIGVQMKKTAYVGAMINALRNRRILVCHTLSDSRVIRIEPPLGIPSAVVEHITAMWAQALADVRELVA